VWKECREQGIKPLIGCEFYICPDRKERVKGRNHLNLWAKDMEGWLNLVALNNIAWTEGFYSKPRIDRKALAEHSKGLICSSACMMGELPAAILEKGPQDVKDTLQFYLDHFGDDFYIELMPLPFTDQIKLNKELLQLSHSRYKLNKIGTFDCHMVEKSDAPYHKILLMVQTGQTVKDKKQWGFDAGYYASWEEMHKEFSAVHPDWDSKVIADLLDKTDEVGSKIKSIEFDTSLKMPNYGGQGEKE